MVDVDIQARTDIRSLKAQLGGVPDRKVIGRRDAITIKMHDVTRVSTLDTSSDFIWGRDYWDNVTDATGETIAYWDGTDTNSLVVVRVVSRDNTFKLFTPIILDNFTDADNTSATVDSANQTITF